MEKEILHEIAEIIFSLFVVNTASAGIQQADGKYIRKTVPIAPYLIEAMITAKGSMGCYQQGYKTGYLKWICLDFDCKDKDAPDLHKLYREAIAPITEFLEQKDIHYLTEFSGRRGIHIWIIFNHIIKKSTGYQILQAILRNVPQVHKGLSKEWNLDEFPATDSSRNNIVGKQVKFPLSTHRKGGMAYFFENAFDECLNPGTNDFFRNQLDILSRYQENSAETVMAALGLEAEYKEVYSSKYKKYGILRQTELTTGEIWSILSQTRVYREIQDRMRRGQSQPRDWTVILGTLSPCEKGTDLIRAVLSEFPNYDEEKTTENLRRLKDRYYPATFEYLYYLYGLDIEENLDPGMTGFEYLCQHLGLEVPENVELKDGQKQSSGWRTNLQDTVNKEIDYLLYNDESPDIYIWNQLHMIRKADRTEMQAIVDQAAETGRFPSEIEPYRVYKRIESEEKTRKLVSLSARDRVITTQLALDLCREYKHPWRSYSYQPILYSRSDIFYAWYRSWENYIRQISTFLDVPFFAEYRIAFIDLSKFYDHVDFLGVCKLLQKGISEKAANILKSLIAYNDALMSSMNGGERIGVPQGPAYARIIAEIFLNQILSELVTPFQDEVHLFRYVDDITIIGRPGFDMRGFYQNVCNRLRELGLPINPVKSACYDTISRLNAEQIQKLKHSDHFDYELRNDYNGEVNLMEDRNRNLSHYLEDHEFNMQSLGYIFGNRTMQEAKDWCFGRYREEIISSEIGRGSNFRRFYEYVFQHEPYFEVVMKEQLFKKIPPASVNFSNFIDTLYLLVQKHEINAKSFDRIRTEYLDDIDESCLVENDLAVVQALRMIRMEDNTDEL